MLAQSGFRVFIAEQAPLPDPRYLGATVQSIYIAVPGKGQAGTGSYIEEVAKKIEKLKDVMHLPSYGYITDIEGVMQERPELNLSAQERMKRCTSCILVCSKKRT
ncbi:MAG: hypothetical protein ACK48P_06650 [Holosporales bacterium]